MAKLGQASGQVHKCLTDPNLVEDGCTKNALFVLLTRHSMLIVMLVSISMHYGYYPQDIYLVDLKSTIRMFSLTCSFLKEDTKVSKGQSTNFKPDKWPILTEILSKKEICVWLLGSFGVFFKKRTC